MSADESRPSDVRYADTFVAADDGFSDEQQDIALAAAILHAGVLTERQLSVALSTWTIHGSIRLAEHLRSLKLLDEPTQQRMFRQSSDSLANCSDAVGNGSAGKSVLLGTLDTIDPSGTIARLMGIRAVAGAGATDATGRRQAEGRYRLVRKLGQGGLGRVWLAFDEHLKRHVALKEISIANQAAARERFCKEAEITGRLEHPGIVPIYQLGNDAQTGDAFYAMRFLGKRTLHDAILEYHERRSEGTDNPMLLRQLLTDFVNICQAIGHAHSRKVIHRDLKPENVAIDNFGQVIVIDWGIAKVIDELHLGDNPIGGSAVADSDQSTLHGQVLGTPLYMAPEQASGRIDELDERTDVYGLGAILFAILTGYAPHEQTRDVSGADTGRGLLTAIAARPTPNACDVSRDVDEALAAICTKAMARRQYARYQTASELAEDVQRWMAGEPVSAHHERLSQRTARWVQKHRIWSQVIAAGLIIGIVALATLAIAKRQDQLAERQIIFDQMRGFAREIEVQVKSTAEELAKDARFMSNLPPIQGIVVARAGTTEGESEDVWQERLETIYEGSLRANPDYVAISYVAADAEDEGRNVARVERNVRDAGSVRRVPRSRLGSFTDTDILQQTAALAPGDIRLMIRREGASENTAREGIRLLAATPVYDDSTGNLFGFVVVEMDLLDRLVQFLERVEQRTASIDITDSRGIIWVSDDPEVGVDVKQRAASITKQIPETSSLFEDSGQYRRYEPAAGWIAARIPLDPTNPTTSVGVVLRLWNDE